MNPSRHWTAGASLLVLAGMSSIFFTPSALAALPEFSATKSGVWRDLSDSGPFKGGPETSLLLTDGTVAVHDLCFGDWYRLTPDKKGKYEDGTWTALHVMPKGYGPWYFASQILPDGRVIVSGGEFNLGKGNCSGAGWNNMGALYDPVGDSWSSVTAPTGWKKIGDAPSVILPDGAYMLADCCNKSEAIATISGTKVTWTKTGTGKADSNSEEGWTLLPDGNVLAVDTNKGLGSNPNDVENYDASTGRWSAAATTAQQLVDPNVHEIGPAVLRPDGNLVYFGAVGRNDIYNTATATWSAGPDFPTINGQVYDCADAPAALLPSGNVLVQASPGVANIPSHFFEFAIDAKGVASLTQVNDPATAPRVSSYMGRLVELPTGQLLWTNSGAYFLVTNEVATYTPKGASKSEWRPKITSVAATLTVGSTGNVFSGEKFNGFSQGAAFGDDAQMASNYPLVRITNTSTGDVCFGRSYGFSTMGVWTTGTTNALFDLPSTCETGAADLQVIVNGIASPAVSVTLK